MYLKDVSLVQYMRCSERVRQELRLRTQTYKLKVINTSHVRFTTLTAILAKRTRKSSLHNALVFCSQHIHPSINHSELLFMKRRVSVPSRNCTHPQQHNEILKSKNV